jgi:hypothetical protein
VFASSPLFYIPLTSPRLSFLFFSSPLQFVGIVVALVSSMKNAASMVVGSGLVLNGGITETKLAAADGTVVRDQGVAAEREGIREDPAVRTLKHCINDIREDLNGMHLHL